MATAVGMIETKGMVGLVAATDAMAKAANVQVIRRIEIGGGYVTTLVKGDVGNVKASVEAGVAALKASGGDLVASHMIASPHPGIVEEFVK